VLAMLLLVILSALGMYAVSVPIGTGENPRGRYEAAVARNMARAGAYAAIARIPMASHGGLPYVRHISVGFRVTGRYSVTSRKADPGNGPGQSAGSGLEEYDLISVGGVTNLPAEDVRVVARIRLIHDSGRYRVRILKWEESAPR
jgi:hypothetical protein